MSLPQNLWDISNRLYAMTLEQRSALARLLADEGESAIGELRSVRLSLGRIIRDRLSRSHTSSNVGELGLLTDAFRVMSETERMAVAQLNFRNPSVESLIQSGDLDGALKLFQQEWEEQH